MKIYFVAYARMPSEKAHGIQIAKMCEAFLESGADLTLVVPARGKGDIASFYGLARTIPLVRLPVLDLHFLGRFGYVLTALQFMIGSYLYLWSRILSGERSLIYTLDMDRFSFAHLAWLPRPVFAEMHSAKRPNPWLRAFFERAGIIATNTLIAEELKRAFLLFGERLSVEPNGVDASLLENETPQGEARARLGLPPERSFALYAGRFYAWKGLEILSEAAPRSPLPLTVVGGTREEYERVSGARGDGLEFAGARPFSEIPLWQRAADALLILGTRKNEESYRYTSPMKVFEYLASGRPVVASRTPALTSIIPDDVAFWYEPDDAESLGKAVREALESPERAAKVEAARRYAAEHTWRRRAERILEFMHAGH